MNTIRRIVKNSGASFLTQVSTPASSFVLVYFIARFLGVSGLGTYTSALSMLFIFQAFASLGFQHLITREVAQDRSKASKFFVNASFLACIFSIPIAGFMCIAAHLITDDSDVIQSVYVLSISLVPYSLGVVCQSISRGFEKLEHITIAIVIGNVFKLSIGIIVLFKNYGLTDLMFVILGSHILIFVISFLLTLSGILKYRQDFSFINFVFCRWILKTTPVFALIFIVAAIRMYINIIILTSLMGAREVGFFSAADRLVNLFSLGISFYIMAIQPVVFRLFKSSFEKFEMVCTESIRYFFIMMLPIIAGMTILGDRFILMIFKAEFLPSIVALNILIWVLILKGFNQIFANALIASNNQKINLKGNIIGMLSNVCLSILLIPTFSFIGAAIANVAAALITFIYQNYFVTKFLFKINILHSAQKPIAATILTAMIIFLLRDINLVMLVLISAITYLISLWVLKSFSAKDRDLLRKLLRGDEELSISKS